MSRTEPDHEGIRTVRLPLGVQPFLEATARHAGISFAELMLEGFALVLKRLRIPIPADLNEVRPHLPEVYP